jgi:hypothetical protein
MAELVLQVELLSSQVRSPEEARLIAGQQHFQRMFGQKQVNLSNYLVPLFG